MRRFVLVALLASGAALAQNRGRLLARLETDLGTALTHSELDSKDKSKLQKEIETLRKLKDRQEEGKKLDRGKLRGALDNIRKHLDKHAAGFRAEDRQAVLDDIRRLQPQVRERERPQRIRPINPRNPYPGIPRRRRF